MRIPLDARLGIAVAVALIVVVLAFLLPRPPVATVQSTRDQDQIVQGSPQAAIPLATLAQHATQEDCWVAVRGNVYDVTTYINVHPGGRNRIINQCGKDATRAFETQGGGGSHSSRAWNLLTGFIVGPLEGAQATGTTTSSPTAPSTPPFNGNAEEIIQEAYPGATILKIEEEDDGQVEARILFEGRNIKVKIDAEGNIDEDD